MALIFVTNGLHLTAGTEKVIVQLATELSSNSVIIYVPGNKNIAFKGYDSLQVVSLGIGDFPTKGIVRKIFHRIKYASKLINKIKKDDTIFSFSFDLNTTVIALSYFRDFKVIASEHIEHGYHKGIRNIIRKFFYKKRNVKVICLTETDRRKFINDGMKYVYCIPNFIYPISNVYDVNNKNILAVGRLEYQKNFSLLISSFILSDLYKLGWTLTIVGEGSELSMLNQLIKNASMEKFISIKKYTKNIAIYYKDAGIFCMTSRFEAFPMVLLEAMNNKLPVLVTDFPTGAKEILGNDYYQIVEKNSSICFSNQLSKICSSPELRLSLSEKNRITVENYRVEKIINQWKDVI